MGSLVGGWDSPVRDPKSVEYRRNWSLTKEEIDGFWKMKKKTEEEHLNAISSPLAATCKVGGTDEEHGKNLERSSSLPMAEELEADNGWWTRSSSAFLNEPPVIERSSNTYASQFHTANAHLTTSNTTKPRISAN